MRSLLIINPISGTHSKDGLENRVRERLSRSGIRLDVRVTEYAGHGFEIAKEAVASGYDSVIAAGGDGTVNEIASALAGSETALGILPFGSGNGLARHLYGSIDVDNAIEIIGRHHAELCDYGMANGRPFFCTFGLGFDAQVSNRFAELPSRGLATYLRSAFTEIISFQPQKYELISSEQSVCFEAAVVAVCNASQYGNNAYIAPKASIRDGLLDIIIIHSGHPLNYALAGVELFIGNLDKNLLIETMRLPDLTIRRAPGVAHLDGEPCQMPEEIVVECKKNCLKLIIDPSKQSFKPFLTPIDSVRKDSSFIIKECFNKIFGSAKIGFNKLFGKKD